MPEQVRHDEGGRRTLDDSTPVLPPEWVDPDDAPEWADEMFDVARVSIGGKVIREATGYLGPNGVVRGRPPSMGRTKSQVTLRLDPDVIERFREKEDCRKSDWDCIVIWVDRPF